MTMTQATPLRRLAALLIDAGVCILLYVVLKYGFGLGSSKLFVLYVLLGWALFALPTASRYGGSLGTWLMGMGVTDCTGQRVFIVRASCRALFPLFSLGLFGMGYALMFFTTRRQTLHDLFTNTLVVTAASLPPVKKKSAPTATDPVKDTSDNEDRQ